MTCSASTNCGDSSTCSDTAPVLATCCGDGDCAVGEVFATCQIDCWSSAGLAMATESDPTVTPVTPCASGASGATDSEKALFWFVFSVALLLLIMLVSKSVIEHIGGKKKVFNQFEQRLSQVEQWQQSQQPELVQGQDMDQVEMDDFRSDIQA